MEEGGLEGEGQGKGEKCSGMEEECRWGGVGWGGGIKEKGAEKVGVGWVEGARMLGRESEREGGKGAVVNGEGKRGKGNGAGRREARGWDGECVEMGCCGEGAGGGGGNGP